MLADGKLVAEKLRKEIEVNLIGKPQKTVCFVIFGNNKPSLQFIGMKRKFAESLGIEVIVSEHSENTSLLEAKNIILNIVKQSFSGVVIQLPLPKQLSSQEILNMIPIEMDIDVLSDNAKEDYKNKTSNKIPPVAGAVLEILNFYNVDLKDKEILVIGNGKLVGEPVSMALTLEGVPFSVIDKDTEVFIQQKKILNADIIISGAGSPHMIKLDMIKEGVILIDAGTSEQNGKILGDVDPLCVSKATLLTSVPGGVGPVTLASLFLNL